MALRASVTDRSLDLPPPYDLVTLRESGDAFARATTIAGESGAGTLVWVRRFDVAEFSVVLEPEEPLRTARRAFYVGMNALADALAAHAPPERPIAFDWPDAIRVDGVLVGGGRLGWLAGASEEDVPDWLVFGAIVRTAVMRAGDPGLRPLLGSLEELGFEGIDPGELLASFARYFLAGLHDLREIGFAPGGKRWTERMARAGAGRHAIAENGDLLAFDASGRKAERRSLVEALAVPTWRDPKTGMPWL
jgi:hypothetical protein